MFAVRSHARKYATIERQRRENPIRGRLRDRHPLVQIAPDPGHAMSLLPREDAEPSSVEIDEFSIISANLLAHMDTNKDIISKGKSPSSYESADFEAADSSNPLLDAQRSVKMTITSSGDFLMEVQERGDDDGVWVCLPPMRVGRHFGSQAQGRISPLTILGAGRIDPFQSYPIKTQPYMHQLVDHCKLSQFLHLQLGDF
jgi:hypothetical protein